MIMAELTSDEIDRVGIWQGMSGSPGLREGRQAHRRRRLRPRLGSLPVAGITPAEEMYRLLEDAPTVPAARATLRLAEGEGASTSHR